MQSFRCQLLLAFFVIKYIYYTSKKYEIFWLFCLQSEINYVTKVFLKSNNSLVIIIIFPSRILSTFIIGNGQEQPEKNT